MRYGRGEPHAIPRGQSLDQARLPVFAKTSRFLQKLLSHFHRSLGKVPHLRGMEARVARPWRLRHKLMLGLALVVASIALLLGGAVFGLSSFVDASHTTEHKLRLMSVVFTLCDHVHQMSEPPKIAPGDQSTPQLQQERSYIRQCLDLAEKDIVDYRKTMDVGRSKSDADPDEGAGEHQLLDSIAKLISAMKQAVKRTNYNPSGPDIRIIDEASVRATYGELTSHVTELFNLNKNHIEFAQDRAKSNNRRTLIIVYGATFTAIVLLLTLLYYSRVWVFRPIKSLQRGVQRVHRGDFEHPINIQSRDELEELANEFNAMTIRLRDIYKDLARQVNERSRQLVRSERMVSVGFLAAGVAHEINNPLPASRSAARRSNAA